MRLIYAVFMVLALSGCATGPSLQSQLAAYIGTSATGLVGKFGVPDRQLEVNGVKYFLYQLRYQAVATPLMPPPYWGPGIGWYGPMPQSVQVWACAVTFTLVDDRVQSFSLRGNDCR